MQPQSTPVWRRDWPLICTVWNISAVKSVQIWNFRKLRPPTGSRCFQLFLARRRVDKRAATWLHLYYILIDWLIVIDWLCWTVPCNTFTDMYESIESNGDATLATQAAWQVASELSVGLLWGQMVKARVVKASLTHHRVSCCAASRPRVMLSVEWTRPSSTLTLASVGGQWANDADEIKGVYVALRAWWSKEWFTWLFIPSLFSSSFHIFSETPPTETVSAVSFLIIPLLHPRRTLSTDRFLSWQER